jgi:hypothetical protein
MLYSVYSVRDVLVISAKCINFAVIKRGALYRLQYEPYSSKVLQQVFLLPHNTNNRKYADMDDNNSMFEERLLEGKGRAMVTAESIRPPP